MRPLRWACLAALLLVGCGDPCVREAKLAENKCGVEIAPEFDTGEQACGALDEKEAKCALDHKDDYCEWLEGLQDGTVVENAYVECLRE